MQYYFLASLLPPLEIGHVPALGFKELKELLDTNLTDDDKKVVRRFLSYIDMENLRALWAHEPLDPRGNYSKELLEEALQDHIWPNGQNFPPYLSDFLDKYRTREERLRFFPFLISQFFQAMIGEEKGFLRDFFSFLREVRLVLIGFRAKKLGKNIAAELQFEDSTDPIVAQILAQRDAAAYEPPFEYKELRPIFEEYGNSPLELHRALYVYQFNYIVELWGRDPFSLDRILNYMARLILVERWLELDVQKGIKVVDTIEKEIGS